MIINLIAIIVIIVYLSTYGRDYAEGKKQKQREKSYEYKWSKAHLAEQHY